MHELDVGGDPSQFSIHCILVFDDTKMALSAPNNRQEPFATNRGAV